MLIYIFKPPVCPQFQGTLGHCVLKANFPLGSKELQVSLFQALVLLLFNDHDTRTYSDIKALTNIEASSLVLLEFLSQNNLYY